MPNPNIVFSSIAELFGLFAIGWLIRRWGYAEKEDFERWGKIATAVFYPFLIFHSIIRDFDPAQVRTLWIMPSLAFGLMLVGALAGLLLRCGLQTRDPATRRTFVHLCAVNNFLYLPIFIIQNSLPAGALADFFVFNLGSTIGFWTIGISTLGGVSDWRGTLRHLISPPLISMFSAIVLACLGARDWLPPPFLAVCQNTGSLSVPLMLIVIGATMQGAFRPGQARDLVLITLIRLILLPAAYIAIIQLLPLPGDLRLLAIIVALMPTSSVSPVMSGLYGGVPAFAAAATLVTHLAALVSVPFAFWWLSRY